MIEIDPDAIERAWSAVEYAQKVRGYHGRRTPRGDKMRQDDIEMALDGIKSAMDPIRRYNSSTSYLPDNERTDARLQAARKVSKALQSERMKLWKMRSPRKPNNRKRPQP